MNPPSASPGRRRGSEMSACRWMEEWRKGERETQYKREVKEGGRQKIVGEREEEGTQRL